MNSPKLLPHLERRSVHHAEISRISAPQQGEGLRLAFGKPFVTLAALLLGLSQAPNASANDATFGGAGADLIPLSESRVKLESEDIVLTADAYDWHIKARYVLKNLSDEKLQLQVGFPEYRCDSGDEDCHIVAFRNLRTTLNGTPVRHRQGTLDARHKWADFLGVVWLFDVTFEPHGEVIVEHGYTLSSGGNIYGNLYTSYVTRTGQSWAGPIGHARFTAVLPPFTRAVRKPDAPGLTIHPPKLLLEPKPRVELVLEGKDWVPEGGLSFEYNGSSQVSLAPLGEKPAWNDVFTPPAYDCSPKNEPDKLQDCLNAVYAAKGYPFKSERLRAKYYSGNSHFRLVKFPEEYEGEYWLRGASPLAAFTPAWFSRAEQQQIVSLRELIAEATSTPEATDSELLPEPGTQPEPTEAGVSTPAEPSAGAAMRQAAKQERHSTDKPVQEAPSPEGSPAVDTPPERTSRCTCRLPGDLPVGSAGWPGVSLLGAVLTLRRRSRRRERRAVDDV